MSRTSSEWGRVKTTETTLDIIELLEEVDEANLTTIATELGLAKGTVHRHLGTLQSRGYVVRENGQFHVGLRFSKLGEHARSRKEEYLLASSMVEELAEETGERVQFMIEEHDYAVYACVEHGEHAVKTDPGIGSRIPLHTAASGKAIMAHLPDTRVQRIIEQRGLPKMTEHTITDADEFHEELADIREQGFAYNSQEAIEGLLAIGAPVRKANGHVIGAVSISGPTHRMKGKVESELAELLLGATNELELNINYS